jgi:competence protein ComEA
LARVSVIPRADKPLLISFGTTGHGSGRAFSFAPHQPETLDEHPRSMRAKALLLASVLTAAPLFYTSCTACSTKPQSPDQLRQQTAAATATIKDDAKAVAQGVRDGLTRPTADKPLDLNSASKSHLMTLPGIDGATADRIIANRPYSSEHELLEKHIVSRDEYNQIADSITIKK